MKINCTDAAVKFCLHSKPDLLAEWKNIKGRANDKGQRRNQLVHFSTSVMFNEKHENDKIRLEPQMYGTRFGFGDENPNCV
jgi:hypothetical protein